MGVHRGVAVALGVLASALACGLGFVTAVGVALEGAFQGSVPPLAPLGSVLAVVSGVAGLGVSLLGLWRPRRAGLLLGWLAAAWGLGMALALLGLGAGPGPWPLLPPTLVGLAVLAGASAFLYRAQA